ncbi:MAG: hypothetical protein QNJ13_12275 [Paracoccaceae bacterium]|nr:hypothetical protein [Paracoccaceae bacterium]
MGRGLKTLAIGLAGLWLTVTPAAAEQLMFQYYAMLTPQDTYNSRGAPLGSVCAIVQQDRANVHKFGKRDAADEVDPFFTSPERRAMIAGKCDYQQGHHTVERIRSQVIGFVLVRVYGQGGGVTRVQISEAAG